MQAGFRAIKRFTAGKSPDSRLDNGPGHAQNWQIWPSAMAKLNRLAARPDSI
jgi:hypothetical protein